MKLAYKWRLPLLLIFVALFLLGLQVTSKILTNRAAIISAHAAIAKTKNWEQAEQAWQDVLNVNSSHISTRRSFAQLYRLWFRDDPSATEQVVERLATRSDVSGNWSEVLAYVGDVFRGQGWLSTAAHFYNAALKRSEFSTFTRQEDVQHKLELILNQGTGNFLHNGDFGTGLASWDVIGDRSSSLEKGVAHLHCLGCQLAQNVPLIGANLYRLSLEARSGVATDSKLQVNLRPTESAPWFFEREIVLDSDWKGFSELLWFPWYGSPELRLELIQLENSAIDLRKVRFEKADAPENHLINTSFDYVESTTSEKDDIFPPWVNATFWNEYQAQGLRKVSVGNNSPGALELRLTNAVDYPYQIGVQQGCGEFVSGTLVELEADVMIPHDLQGAYAAVDAVIFHPNTPEKYILLTLRPKKATSGWVKLATTNRVPTTPLGPYACMLIVHLVAEQPLSNTNNIARFDNLVLQETNSIGDQ